MQTSIFQDNFRNKAEEVCIKRGQPHPHIHSKARVLTSQLQNGLLRTFRFDFTDWREMQENFLVLWFIYI